MRTLLVIGIGAGDPEYLTMQAVHALNRVDVFFVVDKGTVKDDLVRLREEILRRYVPEHPHRVVVGRDAERDRDAAAYPEAVDDWRRRRADVYEDLVLRELPDGGTGGFLVWGDPTLYDSTLAVLDQIAARGRVAFTCEVVPGISSVSALAARHRVPLNRVGRSVRITTGRRLAQDWPGGDEDVVVMLDSRNAFADLGDDPDDVDIVWGAYVGTPDEILVSGRLADVAGTIREVRAEARERHGWIMDVYLLRRR